MHRTSRSGQTPQLKYHVHASPQHVATYKSTSLLRLFRHGRSRFCIFSVFIVVFVPDVPTRPPVFWELLFNSEFLRWPMSTSKAECTVPPYFCASWMTFLFCSLLWSLAMLGILRVFPILCPQQILHQGFYSLEHRNELVHNIFMTQRIEPFSCNAIFMIFRQSRFQTLSRRFMSFYDARTL